jgi:hypothetical protein
MSLLFKLSQLALGSQALPQGPADSQVPNQRTACFNTMLEVNKLKANN